jgi:magnesium transporter
MIKKHVINKNLTWFEVIAPNQDEQEKLISENGLTSELLFYALDPNESARTEIDRESGNVLIIFDIVSLESDAKTEPVAILFDKNNNFYTITRAQTLLDENTLFASTSQLVKQDKMTALDIFLNGTYVFISQYINAIQNINRRRNVIQANLRDKLKATDIGSLMELQTQVIYMVDSLKTDKNAVSSLKNYFSNNLQLTSRQSEYFDDLIVENSQAIDMAIQAGEVIDSINNAYSGLHNQKLDRSLRLLTVVQAIMAVPTVVTGFYGMNVKLPFAHLPYAWVIAVIFSILIIGIEVIALFRWNFFDK